MQRNLIVGDRLLVPVLALQQCGKKCLITSLLVRIRQGFFQRRRCLLNRTALHLQARQQHGESGVPGFNPQSVLQHTLSIRAALAFQQQSHPRLARRIMAGIQPQRRLITRQCIGDTPLLHQRNRLAGFCIGMLRGTDLFHRRHATHGLGCGFRV